MDVEGTAVECTAAECTAAAEEDLTADADGGMGAVVLQVACLHIALLAVGCRDIELFPFVTLLVLVRALAVCCPRFRAGTMRYTRAEGRYCLVQDHDCSTHAPARLRAAEGCCLYTKTGSTTGHLVCVYLPM